MTDFTSLEIQLIRSSLHTKTDDELSELLERPVNDIIYKINEITDGGAEQRMITVLAAKDIIRKEKEIKKKKSVRKEFLAHQKQKEETREEKGKRKRALSEAQEVLRRKELAARNSNRVFETRVIDLSKMKSVRVNRTTHVWVPIQMSDMDAIKKYNENLEWYKRKHLPTN